MKIKLLTLALFANLAGMGFAAPLSESTFTEVVKEVNVVASATKTTAPAQPNALFKSPDLVRTGAGSRAELTAPDQTITRVGANTVFSFEPVGRSLNLEEGNILFHSPKGLGGGTIKSGGVVAAVLGTTLLVSATADGGFKVILLEGKGSVTLPDGRSVTLTAGQMVFILPGQTGFSAVLTINLEKLVNGSLLINGFTHTLPSWPLIVAAIAQQKSELATGNAQDTGMTPENILNPPAGNGPGTLDHGSYQTAVHPTITGQQYEQILGQPQTPFTTGPGGRTVSAIKF